MVRYSQQQEFMLTIFALRYNFRHDQNEGFIWSFAMGSLDELNYRTVCRKLAKFFPAVSFCIICQVEIVE